MQLWGLLCAVVDVGWSLDFGRFGSLPTSRDQPTSITAHNSHSICIRIESPDDGQLVPETSQDFETQ
jgi:hypothetical protein